MNSKHSIALAAALAATLGLALAGATAQARDGLDATAVKVRYGDLDLATDAGARAVYQRLQSAAGRACDVGEYRALAARAAARRCAEAALADAVGRLGSERVAALHATGAADEAGKVEVTARVR